jgi:hypothetical protein
MLANHHVHASAHTLNLNRMRRAGTEFRLTGPTNYGLGDPAALAMRALLTSANSLVYDVSEGAPEPMHLVGLAALAELMNAAVDEFEVARQHLDEREKRLQQRLRPSAG